MNHETEIYIELYRRKQYQYIPLGKFPDGSYFYPTEKQLYALELLDNPEITHIGYGGSARSGKTLLECFIATFDCLAYPGIAWCVGRRELTTLKRTVIKTLFAFFEFHGIKDYNFQQQLNIIQFTNGSEIFLLDTAHQPKDPLYTRFGGLEITRAAVDESNETDQEAIRILYSRTGWRKNIEYGLGKKIVETFNPDKTHVYSRYYKPYSDGNEESHKKFIPALPTDNPHPAVKEWIEGIVRDGDKTTIERLIYGNFEYDDDPSALCDYDAICDIFTNEHVKEGQSYITADLAMQGRDKFIAMHWKGLVGEIKINQGKSTGKSIETDLKDLKIKTATPNTRIIADSDGLGNYLESYIQNIKSFHGGSSPSDKQYDKLKDECAFKLAEIINKREMRLICSKEDQEEIKKQISMCLKRDNVDIDKKKIIKKSEMKERLGYSPDHLDNLIMRMLPEVKKEYSVFA